MIKKMFYLICWIILFNSAKVLSCPILVSDFNSVSVAIQEAIYNGCQSVVINVSITEPLPINVSNNITLTVNPGVTVTFSSGLTVSNGILVATDATINCNSFYVASGSVVTLTRVSFTCNGLANLAGTLNVYDEYTWLDFNSGLTVTGNLVTRGSDPGSLYVSRGQRFSFGSSSGLTISSGGSADCMYTAFYAYNVPVPSGVISITGNSSTFTGCLINYGAIGIAVNGATLFMGATKIVSYWCDLRFTGLSRGYLMSYNAFEGSDYQIAGDENSFIDAGSSGLYLGYNSFRGAPNFHFYSTNTSTQYAQGNYWASRPPIKIHPTLKNVDTTLWLNYDPNPYWKKGEVDDNHMAEIAGIFLKKSVVENDEPIEKEPGIEELDKATLLLVNQKYEEALVEMHKLVNKYNDSYVGIKALAFIGNILVRIDRAEEILSVLEYYSKGNSKVAQYAHYQTGYQYLCLKEHDKGIEIMKATKFREEDAHLKQIRLFDLGTIYHDLLGNKVEAYNYFSELVYTYPDCPLAEVANIFYKITKDGYEKPPTTKDETTARDEIVVTDTKLFANYPNPFNPSTVIKYQLSEASLVSLKVYDVMGREVATLVNSFQNNGSYDVTFNANGLSSGIYVYKLNVNGKQHINKMLLMK